MTGRPRHHYLRALVNCVNNRLIRWARRHSLMIPGSISAQRTHLARLGVQRAARSFRHWQALRKLRVAPICAPACRMGTRAEANRHYRLLLHDRANFSAECTSDRKTTLVPLTNSVKRWTGVSCTLCDIFSSNDYGGDSVFQKNAVLVAYVFRPLARSSGPWLPC
jgi:hypothetical protein